jgi:flagellar hook-length control protein FliK
MKAESHGHASVVKAHRAPANGNSHGNGTPSNASSNEAPNSFMSLLSALGQSDASPQGLADTAPIAAAADNPLATAIDATPVQSVDAGSTQTLTFANLIAEATAQAQGNPFYGMSAGGNPPIGPTNAGAAPVSTLNLSGVSALGGGLVISKGTDDVAQPLTHAVETSSKDGVNLDATTQTGWASAMQLTDTLTVAPAKLFRPLAGLTAGADGTGLDKRLGQMGSSLASETTLTQADPTSAIRKAAARRDASMNSLEALSTQKNTGPAQDVRDQKAMQFTQSIGALTVAAEKLVSIDIQKKEVQLGAPGNGSASRTKAGEFLDVSSLMGNAATSAASISPPSSVDQAQPLEMQVAQQVSYWVSRHVQNAEMTLSGFEGMPVDVSITLQGNQAQVDFRTDQLDIRAVLQGSESHLKDSLAKEGLVLAGLSVGVSTSGGQQASQDRGERAARQFKLPTNDLKLSPMSQRAGVSSQNSIDVFV